MIEKEAKEGRGKDREAKGAERLLSCEDSKQRARQASRQPHGGREGRGSQGGYVRVHAAEPAEDFRERTSPLPGRQQLNGWSAEETGPVL